MMCCTEMLFAQGVSSPIHTLIRPHCVYSEYLPLSVGLCVSVRVGGCVQQDSQTDAD